MPTKAEIKLRETRVKLKIKIGDPVMIISGKDKGQRGFVARVLPKKQRVVVLQPNPENPELPMPLNAAIKHQKATQQGQKSARIRLPMPIHISNVMLLDPKDNATPTRVGRRVEDGKLVRYAKKSDQTVPDLAKEPTA